MRILGIAAYYHDAAACIIVDGKILAAAQEERFTRRRHDARFPECAIDYCLSAAAISLAEVDYVVFYDKPFLKFDRILETYLAFAPRGFRSFLTGFSSWVTEKLFQKSIILENLSRLQGDIDWSERLRFSEHHLSHAASAFFPSPFNDAAILTMDGVGEWATTSLAVGNGSQISILKEIHFPHSLGLLYSAFTYYTGFKVNSGEYKVMGLAPYGKPKYANLIKEHLIDIRDDGSFALDMRYFNFCTGLTMTSKKFHDLLGGLPRSPESLLTQRDMDLAASVQAVTEEVVLKMAHSAAKLTNKRNLCLAGGVALNCVANGKLLRDGVFERVWVQPAAGDAGGALGAALAANYMMLANPRKVEGQRDGMSGAYLGPSFSADDSRRILDQIGAVYSECDEDSIIDRVAHALADGGAIGWMNGRMEFGPRSLGARSILADPRSADMQKKLNLKVKFRESFRPFAPSVLRERVGEWFEFDGDSPYMLFVAEIKEKHRITLSESQRQLFGIDLLNVGRSSVAAVTHVDFSARVQTVHPDTNPRFHKLLTRFEALTGCPVLVNTSFNVRGEPIVCTPEDAYRCFMGTELDFLVIDNLFLDKRMQPVELTKNYREEYELD